MIGLVLCAAQVHVYVEQEELEDCRVDLSGLTLAAGCAAELRGTVCINDEDEAAATYDVLIDQLTDLPRFSSLTLKCREEFVELLPALEQVRCDKLTLSLWNPMCASLSWLSPVQHLSVDILSKLENWEEAFWPEFAWPALASPGLRCLGSAESRMTGLVVEC